MINVLHLRSSIGANAYNLAVGERKNGVSSTVMIDDPTMYSSQADIILKYNKNKYLSMIQKILFCIKNSNRFDVIHYSWGSMLIQARKYKLFGLDLRYFKKKGKIIAVTFQGSDARQARYSVDNYDTTFYTERDAFEQKGDDERKASRIQFYDDNADLIYAINPDLLNVLPDRAKFRPYTKLQPEEWVPHYSNYDKEKTVILHAPTKRHVKGTDYIINAVERLKLEGYNLEFLLLENIPNDEVIECYKRADLVIDQLLVGWYGGFAVECMALGKPVMCYIRESDMKHIPAQMDKDLPIIRVKKETLYEKLKDVLDNKESLATIAHRSRKFVEEWHDPKKIAQEIIADYQRCLQHKKGNNSSDGRYA